MRLKMAGLLTLALFAFAPLSQADTIFEARNLGLVVCVVRIDSHDEPWRQEMIEGCLPSPRMEAARICAALKQYAQMQPGQTYDSKLQVVKEIEAIKACAALTPPPKSQRTRLLP